MKCDFGPCTNTVTGVPSAHSRGFVLHDHETGWHRGWLCNSCNMKLAWFERFKVEATKYLEQQRLLESRQ